MLLLRSLIKTTMSQRPWCQTETTISTIPGAPEILSNATCCHSIRVRGSQSGRSYGVEAGPFVSHTNRRRLAVERDRRRRELGTGAFSLLLGVVALQPLCKGRVRARPRACVCAWGLRCLWAHARSLRGTQEAMGGTSSTRRVTFEADENENITVVKGIRVSDRWAGRRASAEPRGPQTSALPGDPHSLVPPSVPKPSSLQRSLNLQRQGRFIERHSPRGVPSVSPAGGAEAARWIRPSRGSQSNPPCTAP